MLWILPSRAQPPMVDVVKWTFEAASNACASDTVIQSVAAGIGQSADGRALFDDVDVVVEAADLEAGLLGDSVAPSEELSLEFAAKPSEELSLEVAVPLAASPDSDASPPDPEPAADRLLACRSFFAQPEPLKWTAGAAMALRTGPEPHNGQALGGSACTPWMTSNRRPQAAQS